MGPLAGLFGMGGWGQGQPGPEFAEREHAGGGAVNGAPPAGRAGGGAWRGEDAGHTGAQGAEEQQGTAAGAGQADATGAQAQESYAARRTAARREGAEALLRRRGARGVMAEPGAGPAVPDGQPMSDAELARQLQAEEDARWQ